MARKTTQARKPTRKTAPKYLETLRPPPPDVDDVDAGIAARRLGVPERVLAVLAICHDALLAHEHPEVKKPKGYPSTEEMMAVAHEAVSKLMAELD